MTASFLSSKFCRSWHILDLLELGPHLHHRVPDQPWIQRHCSSQVMLCACTRIEAHDEVVPIVVCGLQFPGRVGEKEGAPVGNAADDAGVIQDDFARGFGDSISQLSDVYGL